MASSKRHERPPKNQSNRKSQSKNQHLIVKPEKHLIMSILNVHIRHVPRNFDRECGSAEEEDEWDSPSLCGRMAGDLDTYCQKGVGHHTKVQVRLDKTYSTGYKDVELNVESMST